ALPPCGRTNVMPTPPLVLCCESETVTTSHASRGCRASRDSHVSRDCHATHGFRATRGYHGCRASHASPAREATCVVPAASFRCWAQCAGPAPLPTHRGPRRA